MGNLIGSGGSGLPGNSFDPDSGGVFKVIGIGAIAAGAMLVRTCNFSSADNAVEQAVKRQERYIQEYKTPPPDFNTIPPFEWPRGNLSKRKRR